MRPGRKVKAQRSRGLTAIVRCSSCGYQHMVDACPVCGTPNNAPRPKERKAPRHFEDRHQEALFGWIRLAKAAHPDLAKLYHVPNGGARNEREGARLKAQGVRKGQLDLNLDVARGDYFGLRLELKALPEELGRNPTTSPEQLAILAELEGDGYRALVVWGWEDARAALLDYLRLPRTQLLSTVDLRP